MDFRKLYIPLTAGTKNTTYLERAADETLAPYIRCYWYSEDIPKEYDSLVIPDTCVDIIFSVNRESNIIATFCGVNDQPYREHITASSVGAKTFAVRFYVWCFSMLSGETLQNTRNVFCEAETYLEGYVNAIKQRLSTETGFDEFITISNMLLTKQLKIPDQDSGYMNAVYQVLKTKGMIRIDELAAQCFIGKRSLERLFLSRMDLSPKQFTELVRYQNTWRQFLQSRRPDVNDLVLQFGYTDQSHLLRKFRKYHGITPSEAMRFASGIERPMQKTIENSSTCRIYSIH